MPGLTSSQTVGPYFHLGLIRDGQSTLVGPETKGERIAIDSFAAHAVEREICALFFRQREDSFDIILLD